MSNAKTSTVYLKDINNFIAGKIKSFNSLEGYHNALLNDDQEVLPFLERVIMNAHKYQQLQSKYAADAKSQYKLFKALTIWLYAINGVALFVLFVVLVDKVLRTEMGLSQVQLVLAFALTIVITNFFFMMCASAFKDKADDLKSIEAALPSHIDSYFNDFNNTHGVAMYYALKRNLSEARDSPWIKEIDTYFKEYVRINPKTKIVTYYPSVAEIRVNDDWHKLVDTLYSSTLQKFVKNGASNRDEIETILRFTDDMAMVKDIVVESTSLKEYFINPKYNSVGVEHITEEQLVTIVKTEIVPVFNIKKGIYKFANMGISENTKGLKSLGTFEDVGDGLFSCQNNPICSLAHYDATTGKYDLYAGEVGEGTLLVNKNGSDIYLFDTNNNPHNLAVSVRESPNNVVTVNVANNSVSLLHAALNLLRNPLADKLVAISQKHDNMIKFVDIESLIVSQLEIAYGTEFVSLIKSSLTDILQIVDERISLLASIDGPNNQLYLSSKEFIDKFSSLKFKDFSNLYYHVVKLDNVCNALYTTIQTNLATGKSASNNSFTNENRSLSMKRFVLINASITLVIGYAYFALGQFNSFERTGTSNITHTFHATLDKVFMFGVPLVFVFFLIVLMVSWYKKQEALTTFNRDVLVENGADLMTALGRLKDDVHDVYDSITSNKNANLSGEMPLSQISIPPEKITLLHEHAIQTLTSLDKCNLLIEGSDVELPFPWTDISINMISVGLCAFVLFVVLTRVSPIQTIDDIKRLIKIRTSGDVSQLSNATDDEVSAILKLVAFLVFVMVVGMFSIKLLHSTFDLQKGLYNSPYYGKLKCAK